MDKIERAEQIAKAIVESLNKHKVYCLDLFTNLGISDEQLEVYIREAILDFEADQSLKESIKDHDETYERLTGEKINGENTS